MRPHRRQGGRPGHLHPGTERHHLYEHTLLQNSAIEHCAVELIISRKERKESTFLINVHSNPKHHQQKFQALIHKTSQLAQDSAALLCGDFIAFHRDWGYPTTNVKGRSLLEDTTDIGYHLLNNPVAHTSLGLSTRRDTNPDLTFYRPACGSAAARWRNTGETLGSDHCITEVTVPLWSAAPAPTPRAGQCYFF